MAYVEPENIMDEENPDFAMNLKESFP